MDNTNETQGIRILSITPANKAHDVNVNTGINVEFSADIDRSTLAKNIVVLEDINHIYKGPQSLKDYSKYAVTKGSISYSDKILTYTPLNPFNTDSTYIVMVNDAITDLTGNKLTKKLISCFSTEKIASFPPCEVTKPKYGTICSEMPLFAWKNQHSSSYEFQMSKVNSFEVLICDEMISGNEVEEEISYTPSFIPEEGIYHIRVKSENGEWSDIHQIFIKAVTDDVVASEDVPMLQNFDEFLDNVQEPLEILEIFPNDDDTNIALKTTVFYIKMKGRVDESRIDFSSSYIYGETVDAEHEEYSHNLLDGHWIWIYDQYNDVTFVIFKPSKEINTEEENNEENVTENAEI